MREQGKPRRASTKTKIGTAECRNKRRFKDKEQADHAVKLLKRDSTRASVPCRSYQCPFCNGWHLSSNPIKEDA